MWRVRLREAILWFSTVVTCVTSTTFIYMPDNKMDWSEARDSCVSMGARLAILDSQAVYDEAQAYMLTVTGGAEPPHDFWIGIRRWWGIYYWVDSTRVSYGFWDNDEPKYDYNKRCIRAHKSHWGWKTTSCSDNTDYLCEVVSTTTIPTTTTTPATTTTPTTTTTTPTTLTTTPTTTTTTPTTTTTTPTTTTIPTSTTLKMSLDEVWAGIPPSGVIGLAIGFGTLAAMCICCTVCVQCLCRYKRKMDEEKRRKNDKINLTNNVVAPIPPPEPLTPIQLKYIA
ncbi:uncharacterized protein LOC117343600 [Pecten maximus]|uniref:uncharacterized protein LOC117343600 n=1 Tax=Pecten maximus TaxID=6579 RepID=UPI00145803E4|nr:uncharacterized protein LOC117343600 [Pecten maximus]